MIWTQARRWGRKALVGALAVTIAGGATLLRSGGAAAHHPNISASASCGTAGPLLSWTARSWVVVDDPHAYNYDIDVDVRLGGVWQTIGHGQFVKANNFQFTGTFSLPSPAPTQVTVRSIARGPFGPNGEFGSVGETRSATVTVPQNCTGPSGATCGGTLGRAADYNLFVRSDASVHDSDVEGSLAVGGHLDATSFGVGRALTPASSRIDLAVGGTVGASGVAVHNGSVSYGSGTVAGITTPNGVITSASGAWIRDEYVPLTASAQRWAATSAFGQVTWSNPAFRTMELIGTDAQTNVFAVTAADLLTAHSVRVQVPVGSTVLVNVSGEAYTTATAPLSSVQFWDGTRYSQFGYPSNDPVATAYRSQILWNFYQATTLELGGLAWEGSVLAPYAAVSLSGGQLNGAVIADSVPASPGATTELHPFRAVVSCLPPPEPPSGGGGPATPPTTTPPPVVDALCSTYGTVRGNVFADHNANGARDGGSTAAAADRGLAGVTVEATDQSGATVATATSAPDGGYEMEIVHARSKYLMVRFANLPAGYQPGSRTTSGSTVQFVRLCDDKVDLALQIPGHYCQDNPALAASCSFRRRNAALAVRTVTWGTGWNAAASSSAPSVDAAFASGFPGGANPVAITTGQVGSVRGLAWQASLRRLYVASFVKAGAPIGSAGHGAVYQTAVAADGSGATPAVAFTLPAAAIGSVEFDDSLRPKHERDAGRTGLGSLALAAGATPAADVLYVVALGDRRLYAVSQLDQPTPTITAIDLPLTLPGATLPCPAADVRPGAVTAFAGAVYAGLTCTAESTAAASGLAMYVYRFVPGTGWDTTPRLEAPLTYDRSTVDPAGSVDGNWSPWDDGEPVTPNQPWLTGLAITEVDDGGPGRLVLSLRSRAGDLVGSSGEAAANGDLLVADRGGAGWVLETDLSPSAPAEYFAREAYPWTGTATHPEAMRGSVATVPGFRDVAVGQLTGPGAGGIAWHDVATANIDRAMALYTSDTTNPHFQSDNFGKASGLGDLVALCDEAPISVGDRVWSDENGDGIQQAGELGLKGVRVELRRGGTVVASVVTNGVGAFAFPALTPRTAYQLVIDTAQTTVGTDVVSPALAGGDSQLDSDAVGVVEAGRHLAMIDVTTGAAGANDFGRDFGFVRPNGVEDPCATSCVLDVELSPPTPAGPPPTYVNP